MIGNKGSSDGRGSRQTGNRRIPAYTLLALSLAIAVGLAARPDTKALAQDKGAPAKTSKTTPLTAKEREAQEKAEKERKAKLAQAKAQVIPLYKTILEKYPKSPRCEESAYQIAVIQFGLAEAGIDENGKPLSSEGLERAWKNVADALAKYTEAYPKSFRAGEALLKAADIMLEQRFDLAAAEALADKGGQWIKIWEEPSARPESKVELAPWQMRPPAPDDAAIKVTVYDLRLRGIFAAYLAEKYDKAKQLLSAAGPLEPTDGRIDAEKVQKVGLFFLQKAIIAQKPIWNPDVLAKAKTDPQRTALKLADLYLKVVKPEKSADIYRRIIDKDPVFAPSLPSLELYACIQLARSYAYDQKNHEKAIDVLQTLYKPQFAKEPQLAEGLVWLGTLTYNFTQDPKKAMPHLAYVIKTFPDSPPAERAMYFYAMMAIAAKDKTLAKAACKEFIAKYPQSTWVKHVTTLLNNDVAKMPTKERSSK